MYYIRISLFYFWILFSLVIVWCCSIPFLPFGGRCLGFCIRAWAKGLFCAARVLCGIQIIVKGKDFIPQDPSIVASQHGSAMDTIMLPYFLPGIPVCVLKKELLFIPFFGSWLSAIGMVSIDRGSPVAAMKKVLRSAKDKIHRGMSIVIFPHGSRSSNADALQVGVVGLYSHLKVPVVPVTVNADEVCGVGLCKNMDRTIHLEFHEHIPPGMKKSEFLETLNGIIKR